MALLSSNGSCSPRQTTLRFYDILNGYVVLHCPSIHICSGQHILPALCSMAALLNIDFDLGTYNKISLQR